MNNNYPDNNLLYSSLVEIVSEAWRLKQSFHRVIPMLDPKEQKKNLNKINWFDTKLNEALEKSNLRIINFEGETYSCGIPATAVNLEDFDSEDHLYIKQTLEPTIIDSNSVIIKQGSVIVEKA